MADSNGKTPITREAFERFDPRREGRETRNIEKTREIMREWQTEIKNLDAEANTRYPPRP